MSRKRLRRAAPLLPIALGLVVGLWLGDIWLPASPGASHSGPSAPVAVLSETTRDLGTVTQGAVLRATFAITNAGTRRLILIEHAQGCRDGAADERQQILAPGDSKHLEVEVDTSSWFGQMEHTVHYNTNDPKLPGFTLKVNAIVESPPSPATPQPHLASGRPTSP